MSAQLDELDAQLAEPAILADHRQVRELSIRKAALEDVVERYRRLRRIESERADLQQAVRSGEDPELAELAGEELPRLEEASAALLKEIQGRLVTAEDRRVGSVILEIRAGTGGEEATLWARDLLHMYERYAETRRWKFELLDLSAGSGLGGVRQAIASVQGEGVWAELAFEAGVHSVKRVPETESQGRIHTSTATVAVLPEPEEVEIAIDWNKDVEEHVTTAQGPGGQNVNKVATAVHLVHLPTGIEVRMQESKSQHQNREKARRLLLARLHDRERQNADAERAAERRGQIGAAGRSEKIRTYRYQECIVVDSRLEQRFNKDRILAGELGPLIEALVERETARRLSEL